MEDRFSIEELAVIQSAVNNYAAEIFRSDLYADWWKERTLRCCDAIREKVLSILLDVVDSV